MKIINIETKELAGIVAGLVREGVSFMAFQVNPNAWTIELTGDF